MTPSSAKPRLDLIPWDTIDPLDIPLVHLSRWWRRDPRSHLRAALLNLLDGQPPESVVHPVLLHGVEKYGSSWDWLDSSRHWSVDYRAALRHLRASASGTVLDPESGLPHRHHAAARVVMLLTLEVLQVGVDDRPRISAVMSQDSRQSTC
jgi:hypothetical protein